MHTIKNKIHLRQKSYGHIFFASTPTIEISSTQIRKNFANGKNLDTLLPKAVKKYIFLKNLY